MKVFEPAELVESIQGRTIAVVGDVMLDRYYRGTASRLSPEAPVPVVEIEDEAEHPGGAANVAYNIASLGLQAVIFGLIGNDRAGRHLGTLLESLSIDSCGLVRDDQRPTTVKTRVIADGQHIVRADRESRKVAHEDSQARLLETLRAHITRLDGIVLQDYNKGVFTPESIRAIIDLAREHDVPTFVDPKFENFFEYTGATLFKPNRKETEDALQRRLGTPESWLVALQELLSRMESESVVITLGANGMVYQKRDDGPAHLSTKSIQVADVSGAGDTVIAVLGAALSAGSGLPEAVDLANRAAGIVCEQVGTVPIRIEDLKSSIVGDYA